ncbi:ribosomal protein S6 kinase-like 1 isoform X1 [Xenopus tropicalis]|uniref:Ribosomal protein S6 kinase-like 1 n=1 Tax=Xenopus tropicalis TaxID=8364 RepID=A0A803J736_XENTR|nr:ribosomal protein S6 kinase-like 1 isoform X1 [Xenopus tropicalis]
MHSIYMTPTDCSFYGPFVLAMCSEGELSNQYRVGFTGVVEQTSGPKTLSKRDYLVDAAKQLHVALERDVNEEYEAAFSHYKHGVELLLSGVTVDPSRERRDAVKRKISQYLKRAEEIFNCHLQRPVGNVCGATEGYSSLRFRPIRALSAAVENLKNCKILKIIGKVQLVHDPCTESTFVLKSLMKSGRSGHGTVTIIPQCVPFMVQLQRFYVSDDSLHLQLQYIPGGCLWGQLRKYQTKSQSIDFQQTNILPTSSPKQVLGPENDCQPLATFIHSPPSHLTELCDPSNSSGLCSEPVGCILESQVRLWGAQLILALETLHQEGVLCRDLNPRNLLLDDSGDVYLTYFGQWREVEITYCPDAAERLYVAPEVLGVGTVNEACDWWSLGVLLYEMLTGQSLYDSLTSGVNAHMQVPFPNTLTSAAISLLTELLCYDPGKRLGSGPGGAQKIKTHPFFYGVQWNKLV